jgi:hypothetical protein
VVRPLFQLTGAPIKAKEKASTSASLGQLSEEGNLPLGQSRHGTAEGVLKPDANPTQSVGELHEPCNSAKMRWASQGSRGKEWVSFGTNMSTEEDCSYGVLWNRSRC